MTKYDLVGLFEIAAIFKVRKQTAANWRVRAPDFPKPVAELKCGAIYRRADILRWKPVPVRANHTMRRA